MPHILRHEGECGSPYGAAVGPVGGCERTLHHYDRIRLLQPSARTEAGYRQYGEAELLRLQQILFYKGQDVTLVLAGLTDRKPGDPEVQEAVARHRAFIGNFYPVTEEIYRGLARHYVEHDEFRAFYKKVRPGLAAFLRTAMERSCDNGMKKSE